MLWYEELFLLLLGAPAGPFEVSYGEVVIRGELGSSERRRAIWWDSVKRLSQTDRETRTSFLRLARNQFGLKAMPDIGEENSPSCRRYGLLTCAELRQLISAGMTIGAHTMTHPCCHSSLLSWHTKKSPKVGRHLSPLYRKKSGRLRIRSETHSRSRRRCCLWRKKLGMQLPF